MGQDFFDGSPESARADVAGPGMPLHRVPPTIPDHQLLRCIGRGSYGEVWLALNAMRMFRAVKIVDRRYFRDQRPFERELSGIRRFEPISRSHESFIDILHIGIDEANGFFYYVMELGDDLAAGQNIDLHRYSPKTLAKDISRRGMLPWQECLELGLALSQALAELHKRGLVHRDVKPSNIIFVNGVAKLADIGLVADVNDAFSYVGTEGFIPPEGPGLPQADVYALGKILYEAMTGKSQEFPELPTLWDKSPERERFLELNEVILRACNSDLRRRYKNGWDIHADLLVLANGKSVKRLRKLERWLTQARRIAAVSLVVLSITGTIGYQVYRRHRDAIESRQREVGADVAYGNRSMESGDLIDSLPYFAEALRLDHGNQDSELVHRIRLGSVLAQCPMLIRMWSRPLEVDVAAFGPNGLSVLMVEYEGRAQIFDTQTGKAISPRFGQETGIRQGAFSPDGHFVVTSSEDGTACIWRAQDGVRVLRLKHPDKVLNATFSPDGKRIVTACLDKIARVWNAGTGALELKIEGHIDSVLCAVFSPDGHRIATTSRDGTARIWDSQTGHPIGMPLQHPRWVECASFSPDGRRLVTTCDDHKARVWDLAKANLVLPYLNHKDVVTAAEFGPDGRLILTASLDGTLRIWLADGHEPLVPNPILRQSDRVTHAAFGPDGHRIVASCIDGTVRVWDLAGAMVAPQPIRKPFSPDGSRYLDCSNNELRVYDALSKQPISPLIKFPAVFEQAELSQGGKFVLTVSKTPNEPGGRAIQIFEAAAGQRIGPRILTACKPQSLLLNGEGSYLISIADGVLQAWSTRTGTPLFSNRISRINAQGAAFNPAGNTVAAWSGSRVRVLNIATGEELFSPLEHPFPVKHAEFSLDGKRLITCGADPVFTKCYAQVWDAATGRPVGAQMKHGDGVVYASFSPDGARVATSGEDYKAIIWNALTGSQVTPSLPHGNQVWTTIFDDHGKWVVTASSDQTARIWNASTGDPLTPPLRHLLPLRSAHFLSDGSHVVTLDREGGGCIWNLPLEQKPVEDVVCMARVISADSVNPSHVVIATQPESLQRDWERLRAKYPSNFTISSEELARWHEFQAQESENEGQWFAAAFHLEQLLKIRPGDRALAEHLAAARKRLGAAD